MKIKVAARKGIFVLAPFLILGIYALHEADANSGGVIGQSKAGCGGFGCHATQSSSATIVRIETDSAQINPGKTYVFRIVVANPSERAAGCDISVDNNGKLATSGSGLQLFNKELTHTQPRVFTGDSAVWTFKYTAPSTAGVAHIYAAGNAVNLNGTNDAGDHWNTVTYTVNIVAATGPEISVTSPLRDTVLAGEANTKATYIKNLGTAPLTIDHFGLKTGTIFHITDSSTKAVAVGDSIPVTIGFAPTSKATFVDTLHIYSNDASTPVASVALVGVGTAGVFKMTSNPFNMGSVKVGDADTMSVTMNNTGNGTLIVDAKNLTVENPDFGLVAVVPAQLPPFTLKPGDGIIARFRFAPSVVGPDTARFVVTLTEYTGNTHDTTILLIGQGLPSASVAENAAPVITIAPNPTAGRISISGIEAGEVSISDNLGRIVLRKSLTQSDLDLSMLPNGTYMLAVKPMNGAAIYRRIVVDH